VAAITAWDPLQLRLHLASHLAQYMRQTLESQKGYTASVGISTNKLLAKLVGNVHKPNGQTTLLPPYVPVDDQGNDNVTSFMDDHELGKIPGIGSKIAQKIRGHVLQRSAEFDTGLVYGGTKENVRVRDVREYPGMGPEILERLLGGSGAPQGIGLRVWDLLNGCDGTEVGQAREIPTQISIEDSYVRLDTLDAMVRELRMLATKLLKRMHTDLLEDEEGEQQPEDVVVSSSTPPKRWQAHPKTIRLSTRPRPPRNSDGNRNRSFARISKSAPMPGFVFNLKDDVDQVIERLLNETLIPLFRRLHPEKSGWNLSLVNVAATNMADAASEKGGVGRDIAKMFKRQDDVLKQWRVEEKEETIEDGQIVEDDLEALPNNGQRLKKQRYPNELILPIPPLQRTGSEDVPTPSQDEGTAIVDRWESEDEDMVDADTYLCEQCGAIMPLFAMGAHERWHT
jgi:DNA polymerase iota